MPVPDRPLDENGELPTVAIRAPGHHPFVFKKMIAGPVGSIRPRDGDLVRVVDARDGLPIGFGLCNSRSQIALRLLSRGNEPPGTDFWRERIDEAVALRREVLGLDEITDAYRVLHAEGDGLSGLIVDRFADVLSVEIFSLGMYQRIGPILDLLAESCGTRQFRVHVDERIALAEDFPGRPVASPELPDRVTIHEHGVRYRVRFEGGHKTGFFCDQRDNRRDLARFCRDRSVLDVCCYTGGFGLNALIRGGAKDVTGVDLDEKAIAVARENANLNQVRTSLVHADAFGYMRQMGVNGRDFGVVVLDPPKLIPGRDEVALGQAQVLRPERPGDGPGRAGRVAADLLVLGPAAGRGVPAPAPRRGAKAGRSARVLAVTGASADHPGRPRRPRRRLPQGRLAPGGRPHRRTSEDSDESVGLNRSDRASGGSTFGPSRVDLPGAVGVGYD